MLPGFCEKSLSDYARGETASVEKTERESGHKGSRVFHKLS